MFWTCFSWVSIGLTGPSSTFRALPVLQTVNMQVKQFRSDLLYNDHPACRCGENQKQLVRKTSVLQLMQRFILWGPRSSAGFNMKRSPWQLITNFNKTTETQNKWFTTYFLSVIMKTQLIITETGLFILLSHFNPLRSQTELGHDRWKRTSDIYQNEVKRLTSRFRIWEQKL